MSRTENNKNLHNSYVDKMKQIRYLSTPSLEGISDEDEYSERLKKSFIRIGSLAEENRDYLNSALYPMIQRQDPLTEDETDDIIDLSQKLISAVNVENLDIPLAFLLSDKLLQESESVSDISTRIRDLDLRMDTCYALMSVSGRAMAYPEIAERYRREGLRIGKYYQELLDPDRFREIGEEEARHTVLTDARYAAVFYENTVSDNSEEHPDVDLLERMYELAGSPIHHKLAPDYDWKYFKYRTLNYYARLTDECNGRHFSQDMLEHICERTEEYKEIWESDPDCFGQLDNEKQVRMLLFRNRYLAGKIDAASYRDELIRLYHLRDSRQYDLNGIYDNLLIPVEYISLLDRENLWEEEKERLDRLYHDILLYAFRMPNGGSLSSMLEFYMTIISSYRESKGYMSFEDMGLQCMAALHPPTYVHTVMVAKLTSCLARHVIRCRPELMVGIAGCPDVETVLASEEKLCEFAFHAGLCHDFGKLSIIDTIMVYGRSLLDMEFELIKTHPLTGYRMLKKYDSTRDYADAALGHHLWYDGSRGYPMDSVSREVLQSPIRTIILIVQCADCMDAATDSVGRSYSRGKKYEAILEEFREGSGSRYAPFIVDILSDPLVEKDIRALLEDGRRENYRNTYHLIKGMHKGEKPVTSVHAGTYKDTEAGIRTDRSVEKISLKEENSPAGGSSL